MGVGRYCAAGERVTIPVPCGKEDMSVTGAGAVVGEDADVDAAGVGAGGETAAGTEGNAGACTGAARDVDAVAGGGAETGPGTVLEGVADGGGGEGPLVYSSSSSIAVGDTDRP